MARFENLIAAILLAPAILLSSPAIAAEGALEIASNAYIAAKKKDDLYILLDLKSNERTLKTASATESVRLIRTGAERVVATVVSKPEYKGVTKGSIDVVTVNGRNEYGQPDPGSLLKHGSLKFSITERGAIALEGTLHYP